VKDSSDLKSLVRRYLEARAKGDVSFVAQHLSQRKGVLFVGTDPNEWWEGDATVRRMIETQTKELGGEISVVTEQPQAYSEGTVGWVADRFTLSMGSRRKIPMRLTAVLRKEHREWKIVMSHLSIGVRSEDAFGKMFTTQ
jgi:ketosteroid isomerase-like protein